MPPFTDGQNLVESALVWDAHVCFPLRADADLSEPTRYRASGVNLVSVNLISLFYDLGVRQMLLAYNLDNQASGRCMQGQIVLSDYGVRIIYEMNRVGMVLDLTHMGHRAMLEACEISRAPVVFSHSNPAGVRVHVRNIRDDQIKACAGTGGVLGENFLRVAGDVWK